MKRAQRFAQWRTRAYPRWKDHTLQAPPAAASQNMKSLLGLAHAMPQRACDCRSDHMVQQRRANELAELPQCAKQLQPPFARQPAESCGRRTVRSGSQGQPRAWEVGSKANRCSPELNPRAVVPERRSAREIWLTSAVTGGVSAVVDRSGDGCPCRSRTRSSRDTAIGWAHGGGARACAHAIGAGVRRTAEQREGHPMKRRVGMDEGVKWFLLDPLHVPSL